MFVRASTLVLAIAASVIAAPGGTTTPTTITTSQCDTGSVQCCTHTMTADNSTDPLFSLLGSLGLDIPVNSAIGLDCNPLTVIGTGSGAQCSQQPVCCSDNYWNGLVNVGCTPFDLDL